MLYSRAPSIQGNARVLLNSAPLSCVLYSRASSIQGNARVLLNSAPLSCVLYSRARSIRGARSNRGNTVLCFSTYLRMHHLSFE